MPPYLWHVGVLLLTLLVGGSMALSTDMRSLGIFDEDGIVENATAALFLSAFVLSFYLLFLRRPLLSRFRGLLYIAGGLGLLAFLDEVSFGARIFDFTIPRYGEVWLDSAHDIVDLMLYFGKECNWMCLVPVTSIVGVAGGLAWIKRDALTRGMRRLFQSEMNDVLATPVPLFGCFLLSLTAAIVIDSWDQFSYWYGIDIYAPKALLAVEEILELVAALALLLCAIAVRSCGAKDWR